MHKTKLMDIFIKKADTSFFIKLFLLFAFYIKPQNRQSRCGTLKFLAIFGVFKWYFLLRRLAFLVFKTLNFLRELSLLMKIRRFFLEKIKSKNYYSVCLPKNLYLHDYKLFKHKNYYYLKPHFFIIKQNCFAYISSDMGIVFKNLIIDNDTIHGRFDKRNLEILKPYDTLVFENYLAQVVHKNSALVLKKDNSKKYLLIHHWFNYYHWFTETYCRLLSMSEDLESYTLVLSEKLRDIPFVQDSLKMLPLLNIEYIKDGCIVEFKKLYVVNNKKYCDNYAVKELFQLQNLCKSHLNINTISTPKKADRIFIVRGKDYSRNIINIQEVKELLIPLGFDFIEMEAYSFFEQAALMQQVRILIGAHGAGLTNMIFMKEGAHIMELHREINSHKDHHSTVYWRLAGVLKHHYYYQFCKTHLIKELDFNNKINTELHNFRLEVNIAQLKQTVEKILAHE